MYQQNDDDGDWIYGLAVIAAIILCVFGTHAGIFSVIALICLAIAFFKWWWF